MSMDMDHKVLSILTFAGHAATSLMHDLDLVQSYIGCMIVSRIPKVMGLMQYVNAL